MQAKVKDKATKVRILANFVHFKVNFDTFYLHDALLLFSKSL